MNIINIKICVINNNKGESFFVSRKIDDELLESVLFNCDVLFDFDEYDLDNLEFVKALENLDELVIKDSKRESFSENTLAQLNLILKYAINLKRLNINNSNGQPVEASSIFDNLGPNIESVIVKNLNFQIEISKRSLDSLINLKELRFFDCDILQLPVLSNAEGGIYIDSKSSISPEELIDFGISHKLLTDNEEVRSVLGALKGNSPLPLNLYEKYFDLFQNLDKDICISIMSVAELDLEKLEFLKENTAIKSIHIKGGCYEYKTDNEDSNKLVRYSLEEYADVRSEIDKLVSQIEIPDDNDKDREKKIFAQVYKLLGEKISYDHYAISEEGKKDKELQYTCRNLKNGLCGVERDGQKENLTVCAGFADILRNTLSCFGIKSEYVSSHSWADLELQGGAYVEKRDKNGNIIYRNGTNDPMGHAYNLVTLDGVQYYTDLTWDQYYIKARRLPLPNFLKSATEFEISHVNVGFTPVHGSNATVSITPEQQFELFESIVEFNSQKIQSMINEGYLSGFVSQYLGAVKGGRESISPQEVIGMMDYIKKVEDYILARGNTFSNVGISLNETQRFVFETSDRIELERLKKEIKKRREKEDDSFGEF